MLKKSCPRSGHTVSLTVNGDVVGVGMVLDSTGTAYFPTQEQPGGRQYRSAALQYSRGVVQISYTAALLM